MNAPPLSLRSSLLARVAPVHGFSTRQGGVSPGQWASLNLGYSSGDDPERVDANLGRLLAEVGAGGWPLVTAHQVHGADGLTIGGPTRPGWAAAAPSGGGRQRGGEADALVCLERGVVIGVRTADCVPILVADRAGRAVAAVHAGWRGTAAGILPRTLAYLSEALGIPPVDLVVAVGPSIGLDAFEVGPEVAEAAAGILDAPLAEIPGILRRGAGDRWHVDLARVNALLAARAGVPEGCIDCLGLCTASDPRRFFSHRRDAGLTGRHLSVIALGGPAGG